MPVFAGADDRNKKLAEGKMEDAVIKQLTKRDVLKGAGALGLSAFAVRVSAAPAAEAVTPALVELQIARCWASL